MGAGCSRNGPTQQPLPKKSANTPISEKTEPEPRVPGNTQSETHCHGDGSASAENLDKFQRSESKMKKDKKEKRDKKEKTKQRRNTNDSEELATKQDDAGNGGEPGVGGKGTRTRQRRLSSLKPNRVAAAEQVGQEAAKASVYESDLVLGGGEAPYSARAAFLSKAGQEPGYKKTNQDNCFTSVALPKHKGTCLLAVLDGHGPNGHLVSSFVKDLLPSALDGAEGLEESVAAALQMAFLEVDTKLHQGVVDCEFSGCTAVAAVLQGMQLHVAWAGDARALLGRVGQGNLLETLPLTKDHKPEETVEKVRITAAKGRVERLVDENGERIGPYRVWLKYAWVPGLAMSRTIGDTLAKRIGVTAEPDVTIHNLKREDKYLVLATDGIWEFISNEEAMSIVAACKTPEQACEKLVTEAHERWMCEEDGVVDDITCLVMFFEHKQKD